MKVKVTHTVDFDDVPDIVNEIVNGCRQQLRRASEFKFNTTSLSSIAAEVTKVQRSLDLVTSQLDDCVNMYEGYIAARENIEAAENEPEPEVQDGA